MVLSPCRSQISGRGIPLKVMDLCTRCIVMKDGSILADAPVPDIFADCALLEEARLEQPLSYRLMQYGREKENSGQF